MGDFLYGAFIEPIKLLLEVIFSFSYRLTENVGVSIVAVSLAVNFLILPLYKKSDAIQEAERAQQKKMAGWVSHIKSTFKGDERFMMLSAYYKEQHYQPYYALRGSLSLLLQIPFFMAAYGYLSHLPLLQGASFAFIRDLGQPDALLHFGGMEIHLLPILMTVINLLSGYIYTRGALWKEKLQLIVMALLFLVLLYDCPAGLVLYWTLNNIFSFGKNIFMKVIPSPQKVFAGLASLSGFVLLAVQLLSGHMSTAKRMVFLTALFYLFQLPLFLYLLKRQWKRPAGKTEQAPTERRSGYTAAGCIGTAVLAGGLFAVMAKTGRLATTSKLLFAEAALYLVVAAAVAGLKKSGKPMVSFGRAFSTAKRQTPSKDAAGIFFMSGLLLALLCGVLIPLSVVSASPMEFINVHHYVNPIQYVFSTAAVAVGLFLVWNGVVFCFLPAKSRQIWAGLITVLAGAALLNYFVFSYRFGNLSARLQFAELPMFSDRDLWINLSAGAAAAAVTLYFFFRRRKLLGRILAVFLLCVITLAGYNYVKMGKELKNSDIVAKAQQKSTSTEQILPLSKKGTNVVVIMLDRAIGAYIPFIMEERPELKEIFSGFTFYPNTISYGPFTNFGAPSLFGGYEYTPKKINERTTESLKDKHNEALRVLPTLFSQHDYQVTICDPPYAGYTWYPDLSIYDDLKNTKAYHTETGEYLHLLSKEEQTSLHPELLKRNFFAYSIYQILPTFLKAPAYDQGNYYATTKNSMNAAFLNHFAMLRNMTDLTAISDDAQNNCILIQNSTTHEPVILKKPSYLPSTDAYYRGPAESRNLDGVEMKMENEEQQSHYDVNVASMIQLGRWLQYLKDHDAYDNTRIVITADHGRPTAQFSNMLFKDVDVAFVNPLLLMKDFNASGSLKTDTAFMTNADTPTFITKDIIRQPTNPFTGRPITDEAKHQGDQIITMSRHYSVLTNNGNVFDTGDAPWYAVGKDIFDPDSWQSLGPDNAAEQYPKEVK